MRQLAHIMGQPVGQSPEVALVKETSVMSIAGDKAMLSLRLNLRAATHDVHERLHQHAGFTAIQGGTIGLADYRKIIVRLYGFYAPFETALAVEPDRSEWLAADIEALNVEALNVEACLCDVAMCSHLPQLDSTLLKLGALYVTEGSALGGRELARGLDQLLGKDVRAGRTFFIGRGSETGLAWRSYLALLSAVPPAQSAHAEIIKGAVETFAAFEVWLNGWST